MIYVRHLRAAGARVWFPGVFVASGARDRAAFLRDLEGIAARGGGLALAFERGRVVGSFAWMPDASGLAPGPAVVWCKIYVAAECRGRGVSVQLRQAVDRAALAAGYPWAVARDYETDAIASWCAAQPDAIPLDAPAGGGPRPFLFPLDLRFPET